MPLKLLLNARFPGHRGVGAVAFDAERLVALGTEAELRAAFRDAEAVDGGGGYVFPGFVDAHVHLSMLAERRTQLDLSACRSAEEAAARVRPALPALDAGEWLQGFGWDQSRFPGGAFPDRAAIDGDRPCCLERSDGHALWVNTAALAAAEIGEREDDPPGGRYLRRADGSLTGVLLDAAADRLRRAIPPRSPQAFERALAEACRSLARLGLVAVHDAAMDVPTFDALERLEARGELAVRVYAFADVNAAGVEALFARERRPILALGGVKLFLDGALGSRGAALFDDYADDPGNRGLLRWSIEPLVQQLTRHIELGRQPALHALGDRAVALALDALEQVVERLGSRRVAAARPRLEHVQIVRVSDRARMASFGIVASVQPTHLATDWRWLDARLGGRLAFQWRSLADHGVPLVLGSDAPLADPNPLASLHAASMRGDPSGEPRGGWRPEERLSRAEALRATTAGAAYAERMEATGGRIGVGCRAELSVFDRDLTTIRDEALIEARCLGTVAVGGSVSWGEDRDGPT